MIMEIASKLLENQKEIDDGKKYKEAVKINIESIMQSDSVTYEINAMLSAIAFCTETGLEKEEAKKVKPALMKRFFEFLTCDLEQEGNTTIEDAVYLLTVLAMELIFDPLPVKNYTPKGVRKSLMVSLIQSIAAQAGEQEWEFVLENVKKAKQAKAEAEKERIKH